jgi:hypothetical protein
MVGYEVRADFTDTITTGEKIPLTFELCCTGVGCVKGTAVVRIAGEGVAVGVRDNSSEPGCVEFPIGAQFNEGGGDDFDFSKGQIVFHEPGEYPVTFRVERNGRFDQEGTIGTVVVEEPTFDPTLISAACPEVDAPTVVNPDDTITFTASVSNGNNDAARADVVFTFGSATQMTTVTVPANGTTNATVSFTPDEPTDYTYGVGVASATQG